MPVAVPDASAMRALGASLARLCSKGDIVLLSGPLGAGKTTFTQGFAAGLGVDDAVTSPTFVIARVHHSAIDAPDLVHVDAYRLGGLAELDDLGLDASLSESVTVVEWGAQHAEFWGTDPIIVTIERDVAPSGEDLASETRMVTVHWPDGRP
ncbi:MAG: tRNA (adenosine(37)-N6)-threonylcarbamoyltransferase complex ATPase subunit type 1 TsaE [Actinomycetes bacterium]